MGKALLVAWPRGFVEGDEVYVGTVGSGKGGSGTRKVPVAIAVQERGEHAGRMAAAALRSVGGEALQAFAAENVQPATTLQPGAIVKTAVGWGTVAWTSGVTSTLPRWRELRNGPRKCYPGCTFIAGNFKRVLDGAHAGRVSNKHMGAYVGEFRHRDHHRSWLDKA